MKYNEKYVNFLANLGKKTGKTAVCEAARAAYKACCESGYEENAEVPEFVRELAAETGNDASDAEVSDMYDTTTVSFGRSEYLVFDSYDDAVEAAVRSENDLLDDLGFQCGVRLQYIGKNWKDYCYPYVLNDLQYDDGEGEPVDLEEFIDWDDVKSVSEYISKEGINWTKLARDVVDTDGPANSLASYDGNEIELPCGKYAYRTN